MAAEEAYTHLADGDDFFLFGFDLSVAFLCCVLTRIPSQRDTARNGRNARNVRIERNAGISAAPNHIAPKFINDNFKFNVNNTKVKIKTKRFQMKDQLTK